MDSLEAAGRAFFAAALVRPVLVAVLGLLRCATAWERRLSGSAATPLNLLPPALTSMNSPLCGLLTPSSRLTKSPVFGFRTCVRPLTDPRLEPDPVLRAISNSSAASLRRGAAGLRSLGRSPSCVELNPSGSTCNVGGSRSRLPDVSHCRSSLSALGVAWRSLAPFRNSPVADRYFTVPTAQAAHRDLRTHLRSYDAAKSALWEIR